MSPERRIGLAYALERWHGGQWSRGYRLLCKIDWRPRGSTERLLPREDWSAERDWAAHYMRVCRQLATGKGKGV